LRAAAAAALSQIGMFVGAGPAAGTLRKGPEGRVGWLAPGAAGSTRASKLSPETPGGRAPITGRAAGR